MKAPASIDVIAQTNFFRAHQFIHNSKPIHMKTLLYFTLLLAIGMPACQLDEPLIPRNLDGLQSSTLNPEPDANPFSPGFCEEMISDHILLGKAEWVVQDPGTGAFEYVLSANGEAILNDREIGRSSLTLTYDPERRTFAGRLLTRFETQVIEHRFTGSIPKPVGVDVDLYKDLDFNGEAETIRGVVTRETINLLLTDGASCKIDVSPVEEGIADVIISITGTYCAWKGFVNRN